MSNFVTKSDLHGFYERILPYLAKESTGEVPPYVFVTTETLPTTVGAESSSVLYPYIKNSETGASSVPSDFTLGKTLVFDMNGTGGVVYRFSNLGVHLKTVTKAGGGGGTYTAGKGIAIENNVISADTNIFQGTFDEWDALTPAEQAEYDFIATPEDDHDDVDASDVSYDNTTSELDATNVQDAIDEVVDGLGTASGKDFTDTIRPNSHDLVESGSVYSAINNALSAIYTPRGALSCAELTSELLIPANIGSVYQMSDSGVTSALFINGSGIAISTDDNVGIIKAGENEILFNYMGNAFDLTDYQKKDLANTVEGQTTVEGALGALSTNKATQAEVNDIVNVLGAKNLLPNNATSQTINGVTFTVNTDGSITANGTASSNARLIITSATAMINACADADVILSGCPSGGSEYKYQIYTRTSAGYLHDYGDGIVITQGTSFIEELSILVSSGQTVSNIVFKPMIRLASDPDNTYVPYAPTNAKLNEEKMSYADNGVLGAKNVLKNYIVLTTRNGVTYTPNSDGTFIANGTATTNGGIEINANIDGSLIEGVRYKVSLDGVGADKEGTQNGIMLYVAKYLNGVNVGDVARSNKTSGFTDEFVYHKDSSFDNLHVGCYTFNNASFSNSTLKPMIRLASDSDNTYQPYAMTNRELTEGAGLPKKTLIRTLANGKITVTIPKNLGSSYAQGSLKLIGSNADSEAHVTFCLNVDNTAVTVSKLTNLGSKALTLDSASISGNNLVLEISGVQNYAWASAEYFMSLSAGANSIQPTWTFTGS